MATATYNNENVTVVRRGGKHTRIRHTDGKVELVETTQLVFQAEPTPAPKPRRSSNRGYSQWNEAAAWVRRAEEGWAPGGF